MKTPGNKEHDLTAGAPNERLLPKNEPTRETTVNFARKITKAPREFSVATRSTFANSVLKATLGPKDRAIALVTEAWLEDQTEANLAA